MKILLNLLILFLISGVCYGSERYEGDTTIINITDADIAEAVALGASTVDVLPDRSMSYIGMGVTNYGGEEAISATAATTTEGFTTMGISAAKANGGSDFLFKGYIGRQF